MKFKLIAFMILAVGALGNSPLSAMQKPKGLIQAAKDGDLERVRVLIWKSKGIKNRIDREAYLDQTDGCKRTPLMWAALRGNLDVFVELLAAGANVNAQSKNGSTALEIAIELRHRNPKIAEELIHHKNIDIRLQNLAIIVASQRNHLDIIQELIWAKFDIDYQDDWGMTALMEAALQKNLDVAQALLTDFSSADAEHLLALIFSLNETGMRDMIEPMIKIIIEERLQQANHSMSIKDEIGNNASAIANKKELAALLDPHNQDSQNELRSIITKNIRTIEDRINEILKAKFKSTPEDATNPLGAK